MAASVVVSGLHGDQFVCRGELVDEAVFVSDAPRPIVGQVMGQALGLADAGYRVAASSIMRLIRLRIFRSVVQVMSSS